MPLDVSSTSTETIGSDAAVTDTASLTPDAANADTSTPVTDAKTSDSGKPDVDAKSDKDVTPDKKPEAKKPDEGKVVELSRSKRAAEAKATEANERADKAEAELEKYQPVIKLLELAGSDPREFINQLAAVTDLDPKDVMEAFVTKKAGGEPPKTSAEEKIAALEKRIADREAAEEAAKATAATEKKEREYTEARTKNVSTTLEFLKANEDEYPAAFADGEEAAEAIYEVVEARWAALKKTGQAPTDPEDIQRLYKQAADRVNKILVEQTERRAAKLGYKREEKKTAKDKADSAGKADPKSFKGLSSEHTGKSSPARDPNRLLSDEEVLETGMKIFGS